MVFSSIAFLFYFLPLFFFLYYIADKRVKNILILAGSILFYSFGAPRFIFVILGTTFVDFYLVRFMSATPGKPIKTTLLCLSLAINLGLLFYFKYSNFFIDNLNFLYKHIGLKPITWEKLILPIGISFYTFETLTYVIDVYRGLHKPLRNFWDYQLYIILFPKLIAGPIIRFHEFADQIYDHTSFETVDNKLRGFYRFCIGLGKKVLIANILADSANAIYLIPHHTLGTAAAWYGALSYTFQIYFDFSGYSDMAIGLGLMMGFRFPENFNNPYTSVSITDFWRRWHITLGAWMREYLYIPLGGNRVKSTRRLYFNLWLVFLLSGLWHGAAWGFVAWGAYHGFFMVIERLFLGRWLAKIGKFAVLYTFPIVLVGWILFRIEDIHSSLAYLSAMFSSRADSGAWRPDKEFLFVLFLAAAFSFCTLSRLGNKLQQSIFFASYSLKQHFAMTLVSSIHLF